MNITRRQLLKSSIGIVGLSYLGAYEAFAMKPSNKFKIGACDWSIHQRAKVKAMEIGKKIGLDGVQISLGTLGDNMHLREAKIQQEYKDACKEYGI